MQKAIFTIVSNNYLHYAKTLLQSAERQHPDCARFCVIVDTDYSHAEACSELFSVIRLQELGLPDREKFLFRYSILELNTAVKPWAFEHLLENGYDQILYIDPDIFLYGPLDEVFQALNAESNLVITPHLLAPVDDDKIPSELDIRRAGTYNFGFCAIRSSQTSRNFLHWWQNKLVYGCTVDLDKGIFVDQSWIDLVPGLFDNVFILRHPGYNVAYWNLAQRTVAHDGPSWTANGMRLVFFHFSGFNPEYPEPFSKHQNRFSFDNMGAEKLLATDYAAKLIENGARTLRKLPYGYATFADGQTSISDLFRKTYREDADLQQIMGNDPFDRPAILATPIPGRRLGSLSPTYAMHSVWKARDDLRAVFSLTDDDSVARFYDWFDDEGHHYFSESVLAAHKRIARGESAPRAEESGITSSIAVREIYVNQLYLALLRRPADAVGLAHLVAKTTSTKGAIRCAVALALSAESRGKDRFLRRLRQAIRLTLQFTSRNVGDAGGSPWHPSRRGRLAAVEGWSTMDVDVVEQGIWVAPVAVLPCRSGSGLDLVIEGIYLEDYVAQQTGNGKAILSASIGGEHIGEFDLPSGAFVARFNTSASPLVRTETLTITCSAHFVPSMIGLNADERKLAWRARRVALGSEVLLDCARTPAVLPLEQVVDVEGLNVIGYIAAESGVGESARAFARSCNAAGLPFRTLDVGYQNDNRQTDHSIQGMADDGRIFGINMLHVNADQTPRTLAGLPAEYGEGAINIAYWHWEQPALPASCLPSFKGLEEVWVPSGFVQDAVAQISPVPVFKVPHAIEFPVPRGELRPRFDLPSDLFLFLSMYDFDSYQYRKNPQASIAAFREASKTHSHIGLVIKTINGERNKAGMAELHDLLGGLANVFLIDRYLSRNEVYELESACDCFISLHRSEGFGLGLAEMMYLGKPVIATNWSGNTEFMTSMNSFPVEYELRPLAKNLGVYQAGQVWAEVDPDHAAYTIGRVLDDHSRRETIGKRAYAEMRRHYSAAEIGTQYRKRLALLSLRTQS